MISVLDVKFLSDSWSYSGNLGIDPSSVPSSSTETYLWFCKTGHDYPSTPSHKNYRGAGCGYCSGKRVLKGFNDMWTTNPDLATHLLDQTDGYLLTEKSNKRVLWVCKKNHVSLASPLVKGRKNTNTYFPCVVCSNREVLVGYNDLWTTESSVASHLVNPEDGFKVTYGSGKVLLWSCGRHSWSSTVRDIYHGNWCPHCSKSVSKPEEILLSMFEGSVGQYKIQNRFRTDVYVPDLNLIIEYDGGRFHTNKYNSDLSKTYQLLSKKFLVVRVRENSPYFDLGPLPISDENLLQVSVTRDHKFKYLKNVKNIIDEWIKN